MDDTRDIAIEARESGKSAHKRLDGINGQIKRLGDSHETMRTELTAQVGTVRLDVVELRDDINTALYDPEHGLAVKIVELTATVHSALKVAGALAGLLIVVAGSVAAYAIEHSHHHPAPPQASITK